MDQHQMTLIWSMFLYRQLLRWIKAFELMLKEPKIFCLLDCEAA
jgi:hypothetical protein